MLCLKWQEVNILKFLFSREKSLASMASIHSIEGLPSPAKSRMSRFDQIKKWSNNNKRKSSGKFKPKSSKTFIISFLPLFVKLNSSNLGWNVAGCRSVSFQRSHSIYGNTALFWNLKKKTLLLQSNWEFGELQWLLCAASTRWWVSIWIQILAGGNTHFSSIKRCFKMFQTLKHLTMVSYS